MDVSVFSEKEFGQSYGYSLEPVFMPNTLKGTAYLAAHPQARAQDLKDAFLDDSVAGIICAIGGDDTYRLLPYLMEDTEFIEAVKKHPKLFSGFSDTTINHLMFYKLGLSTYYGPNFICDLGEIGDEMLPYTRKAFESYLEGNEYHEIVSSEIWYEERTDFSRPAIRGLPGKPQDETYYEEYQSILKKVVDNKELPIVYNMNFGHAAPRCVLQYGAIAAVDMKQKKVFLY